MCNYPIQSLYAEPVLDPGRDDGAVLVRKFDGEGRESPPKLYAGAAAEAAYAVWSKNPAAYFLTASFVEDFLISLQLSREALAT